MKSDLEKMANANYDPKGKTQHVSQTDVIAYQIEFSRYLRYGHYV